MITSHQEKIVFNQLAVLLVCIATFNILNCGNGQVQPLPQSQESSSPSNSQEAPTVPWYESLPAVAMDYKVIIDAGKEDCYFQFVNPGATFYASAQVPMQTLWILFFSLKTHSNLNK